MTSSAPENPERVVPVRPIEVLGVKIHPVTVDFLFTYIAGMIRSGGKALVANVNTHAINLANELPWFRRFLASADIVFCDGWGVVLGAAVFGCKIPERITYADWIWQLAAFAEKECFSLYFLGARPGVAEEAAEKLSGRFSNLRIAGVHHGYFDKETESSENQVIIENINRSRPNILLLGFGMPTQEKWLLENWKNIRANIALTGGAVFDYASGRLRRPPRFLTDHGLEWLGRLIIEPHRLWRRYLIGNAVYLWRIFKAALK
jgi:N-acetylglucosaminyldiphosphoundecaprenol N-acetyl-beta-D-mannosaminyltransferase